MGNQTYGIILEEIETKIHGGAGDRNDNMKKQHKKNKEITKKPTQMGHRKYGPALFMDITRRGALPKEASIHIAEMITIKQALRDIKIGHEMDNIYRLNELNAGH